MRQLVQDLRSGRVQVVDLPDPTPSGNEALVRTSWSLISPGTEQAVATTAAKSLIGKARDRPDQARKVIERVLTDGLGPTRAAVRARLDDLLTPGYSSAGVVEAVGAGVEGLRPGDPVGCVGANAACHAECIAIPAPLCIPLPPDLDARWGAFGALGGVAAHGVRVAEVSAGSVVLVVGLGLVGQLTVQLVTAAGGRAIGADPAQERVATAMALGATAGAVLGRDDAASVVRDLSGGHGADAVIITAATKDSGPVTLAAEAARDRAIVSVVGDVGLEVPRAPFYEKELQLRLSRSYGPGRYDAAYEVEGRDYPIGYVRWTERRLIAYFFEEVAAGRVRLEPLVTHEFTIDQGEEAYEALSDPSRLAILLRYDRAPEQVQRSPVVRRARPGAARPRVALIGPGVFARSTLLPLVKRADTELVAIAGRTPARAAGVARRWKAEWTACDVEEVIGDESIDVVMIATQHDSHADLAARALEAGKGVFLEKPLAIDAEGLARIEPLLDAGGRLVVDFNRSLSPGVRHVAGHFADRRDPVHVSCRVNAGYLDPDHWLRDPARGGGRLVGEGCHFVDLCSALVGHPVESVAAVPLGAGPTTLAGDSFQLTLRYADGSVATVSYLSSGDASMAKERIEVIGARRAATVEDFRRITLHPGGRARRLTGRRDKGHAAIVDAAFRFFRDGGVPPIPYERMVETTRTTLLARQALHEGTDDPVAVRGG